MVNRTVCLAERDLALPDKTIMYYVYVLKSLIKDHLYVGYSKDLRTRVKAHNSKKVKATRRYAPWKLVYYEAYLANQDATKRERQLKMHAVKEELKSRLKYGLKE